GTWRARLDDSGPDPSPNRSRFRRRPSFTVVETRGGPVEYRILGPLEVWHDGRQVSLGGGHQRALLALLLLHAGEVVSRERRIDGLWGESAPESADKIVQNQVSALRRLLPAATVVTSGRGYRLDLDGAALDLHRFEELRERGRLAEALAV